MEKTLKELRAECPVKFVVLDDDPTGTQTVHDVTVITDWEEDSIRAAFSSEGSLFFILTNSRALLEAETEALHRTIAGRVSRISEETGIPYLFISRSDSTLRGHYPLETEVLQETVKADGEILAPFFLEGGRLTVGDIQYVRQGGKLVPAGETEFAKDRTFGYTSSDLKLWVEEKSKGRTKAADVVSLRSEDGEAAIEEKLMGAKGFNKFVVNASSYEDLEVFALAFFRALSRGKRFIIRSAASIVKVLGGITDIPYLTREDIASPGNTNGGIVLIGSHVNRTTEQLEELLKLESVTGIEFNQHRVLEEGGLEDEIGKAVAKAEALISQGRDVVVYTRRQRLDVPGSELKVSTTISDALVQVIGRLSVRPGFVVAKGGITSSDVATKALGIRRATVMGQAEAGIPVWRSGEESKFPGLGYVIFPGNVGEASTLRKVVENLSNN